MQTLFSAQPQFTIDTCSFNEMFDDERASNKKNFPGIWSSVEQLIASGEIVSHREVYEEIMEGPYDELKDWAKHHKTVFSAHDYVHEGQIIAQIGEKGFVDFVHQGKKKYNADPWLVAQAVYRKLKVITQERKKGVRDLPRVCDEMGVKYLDIFGLVREKNWVFK